MTLLRDTLEGSDLDELHSIAEDLFIDWCRYHPWEHLDCSWWEHQGGRWLTEAETIWMNAEPVSTSSETVPPRKVA